MALAEATEVMACKDMEAMDHMALEAVMADTAYIAI